MRKVLCATRTGNCELNAYTYDEFPFNECEGNIKCGRYKGKSLEYLDVPMTFDIETTTVDGVKDGDGAYIFPPRGFCYHWQADLAGVICYGRHLNDFMLFLHNIEKEFPNVKIFIYVHNLGYEFQFISSFLRRDYSSVDVFAPQKRKPLTARFGNFEMRCSWKLSNMSLEKFCLNEKGCDFQKASGDLDYSIYRTCETPLDDTEFGYCISDVTSLYDAIMCRLENYGDTLLSIPLTSTGYVRRHCRQYARADKNARKEYLKEYMTDEVYTLLLEAGRGGDTHANRHYSGKVYESVESFDFQSAYPYALMVEQYPRTAFTYYGEIDSEDELDELCETSACLFRIRYFGIRVHNNVPSPTIPLAKCRNVVNPMCDNGRILMADELSITVTDIDYNIIAEQYDYNAIQVTDMYTAEYGFAPEFIRKAIMDDYAVKCELKGSIQQCSDLDEKSELEYLYAKVKNA